MKPDCRFAPGSSPSSYSGATTWPSLTKVLSFDPFGRGPMLSHAGLILVNLMKQS